MRKVQKVNPKKKINFKRCPKPYYNRSFTTRYKKSAKNQDIFINLPLKYIFSFFDDLPDLLLKRADIDIDLNITSNRNKCIEEVTKGAGCEEVLNHRLDLYI